jgi:hypothetical protein
MRVSLRTLSTLLLLTLLAPGCGGGDPVSGTKTTGVSVPDATDSADMAGKDAGDAADGVDSTGDTDAQDAADAGFTLPADATYLMGDMPLASEVFDLKGVHIIAVTVDPKEWQDYLAGVAMPDGQKVYDWHPAQITFDGAAYTQVAVRGFGNGSQLDNPKKPNIRLKFDHYDTNGVGPEGQHSVKLKASGQDASFVREPLMYELVRGLGGHAPRTGWARVLVNGEDHGLYQVLEVADKRMFKTEFGNNDGHKYEPKYACLGFDCPSWGCDGLKDSYKGDPGDGTELAALGKAVTESTDATLLAELQARMDLPGLLANYAVDAAASNLDGLASAGQNFEIYVDQKTALIHVIESGADLTFDNFHGAYYPLETPWGQPNSWCSARLDHLYQRIWQGTKTKPLLLDKLRSLQCGEFDPAKLVPRIDALRALLHKQVYGDPKGIFAAGQIDEEYTRMKAYVLKRQDTLAALLGPCK